MSVKDLTKKISNIEKLLGEIIVWLKIGNWEQLHDILYAELDTAERAKIYELTDGINSQKDIASLSRVSRSLVAYYWQKWLGLGILVPSKERRGRMKKIVSLSEVGITPPRIKGKGKEAEVIFKPEDLGRILVDKKMFPTSHELATFAIDILPTAGGARLMAYTGNNKQLAAYIIDAFRKSDRMKQALFMQALERRAHEKKETQFRIFFETWEKHIER